MGRCMLEPQALPTTPVRFAVFTQVRIQTSLHQEMASADRSGLTPYPDSKRDRTVPEGGLFKG